MGKKCCYESFEDGATGRSQHYAGYQDGGGAAKGAKGSWSRGDAKGGKKAGKGKKKGKKGY